MKKTMTRLLIISFMAFVAVMGCSNPTSGGNQDDGNNVDIDTSQETVTIGIKLAYDFGNNSRNADDSTITVDNLTAVPTQSVLSFLDENNDIITETTVQAANYNSQIELDITVDEARAVRFLRVTNTWLIDNTTLTTTEKTFNLVLITGYNQINLTIGDYFGVGIEVDPVFTGDIPVMNLTDSSATPLTDGSVFDFGLLVQNDATSDEEIITMVNNGTAELVIDQISLTGSDTADFNLNINNTVFSLDPSESTSFTLVFAPQSNGSKTAEIEIRTNDPSVPVLVFTVNGEYEQQDANIIVRQGGSNIATGATVNYPVFYLNESSAVSRTFTIRNTGTANLNISSIGLSGISASDFTINLDNSQYVVAPGASMNFQVAFEPGSVGNKTAALSIASNDPDTATYTVNLSGTADQHLPDISISTNSLSFGRIVQGEGTSSSRSITITNNGDGNLNLNEVDFTGSAASQFSLNVSLLPTNLAPGQSTTQTVVFTPTSRGVKNASLVIRTNDPDESTVTVSLNGDMARRVGATVSPYATRGNFDWTVPANIIAGTGRMDVTVIGGGGGRGGSWTIMQTTYYAGYGEAGTVETNNNITVTSGQVYTVTVGAGGTNGGSGTVGGTPNSPDGNSGGNSAIRGNGLSVIADGGRGGEGFAGSTSVTNYDTDNGTAYGQGSSGIGSNASDDGAVLITWRGLSYN